MLGGILCSTKSVLFFVVWGLRPDTGTHQIVLQGGASEQDAMVEFDLLERVAQAQLLPLVLEGAYSSSFYKQV